MARGKEEQLLDYCSEKAFRLEAPVAVIHCNLADFGDTSAAGTEISQ
jgi:hypothetical protein